MAKKIKWSGPLAKPIKWSGPRTRALPPTILPGEPSAESQAENAARFDSANLQASIESVRKLPLLKQHFEVPDDDGPWIMSLALSLAIYADIPGFRVQFPGEGRGRKRTTWMDNRCVGLVLDVERVKAERKIKTDSAALRYLAENPSRYNGHKPSQNKETQKALAVSLNSRLTEARRLVREKKLECFIDPSNQYFIALFGPDSQRTSTLAINVSSGFGPA